MVLAEFRRRVLHGSATVYYLVTRLAIEIANSEKSHPVVEYLRRATLLYS